MRIAMVTPGFSADDSDWCIPALQDLARRLAGVHDVHVYATCYPHFRSDYEVKGVPVRSFGDGKRGRLPWLRRQFRAARALSEDHAEEPFAVVHGFWTGGGGFVALLHKRRHRTPSVATVMAGELTFTSSVAYGSRHRPIAGRIARLGARHADRLIVNSPFHAERIRDLQSGMQPDIVPLGTDTSRFLPHGAAAPLTGEVPVLCVASLVPVKCHAVLLNAIALALAAAPGLHLHLVGQGTEEQALRNLAQALGIADSVDFHGPVDHGELPQWYRGAAFCALASAFESHCMAALEAAACGRVTVGSRVGSLPDLCSPDYLCDAGDVEGLARILISLAQDRQLRESLSARAAANVDGRFSLEASSSAHEVLYRQLVT